jgi:hypothetical protein
LKSSPCKGSTIGYLGLEAVGDYKYPFITSSDAITMKMGIVERVYFFFLVLYILLSIVNIIIHWKVTYDLLEEMLRHQFQVKNLKKAGWWSTAVFGILPFLITGILNDQQIILFGEYWLTMRIAAEMFAVILIASLALSVQRRKKKASV